MLQVLIVTTLLPTHMTHCLPFLAGYSGKSHDQVVMNTTQLLGAEGLYGLCEMRSDDHILHNGRKHFNTVYHICNDWVVCTSTRYL